MNLDLTMTTKKAIFVAFFCWENFSRKISIFSLKLQKHVKTTVKPKNSKKKTKYILQFKFPHKNCG